MYMKMAISIPDDLFAAVERLARDLGLSRSALYRIAVQDFLERHRQQAATEALNAVYGDDPESSQLDPVLAAMQFASLGTDEW